MTFLITTTSNYQFTLKKNMSLNVMMNILNSRNRHLNLCQLAHISGIHNDRICHIYKPCSLFGRYIFSTIFHKCCMLCHPHPHLFHCLPSHYCLLYKVNPCDNCLMNFVSLLDVQWFILEGFPKLLELLILQLPLPGPICASSQKFNCFLCVLRRLGSYGLYYCLL